MRTLSIQALIRRVAMMAAVLIACTGCTSHPAFNGKAAPLPTDSTLEGWRQCTDSACSRNFVSLYSTFTFLRVDDTPQPAVSRVTLGPGRHWIEAYYSWGAGIMVGIGNWRNYGFELDALPGHRYHVESPPFGCIVPAKKRWVHPVTLHVADTAPSGEHSVLTVPAMEYCTPESHESGTCRNSDDCRDGTCTTFGGVTGFGLCGLPR